MLCETESKKDDFLCVSERSPRPNENVLLGVGLMYDLYVLGGDLDVRGCDSFPGTTVKDMSGYVRR